MSSPIMFADEIQIKAKFAEVADDLSRHFLKSQMGEKDWA